MIEIRRILVIRRDNIGDLVCTTPLLTAIRKHYPQAQIGVLANSYNAPVLSGNPDVDDIYAYRKLKHLSLEGGVLTALAERIGLVWMLRRKQLDLVLLAAGPQDLRGARLARLISPRLIACSEPATSGQHEVERTFTAARRLGIEGPIPALRVTPGMEVLARVREAIQHAGLEGMHPLVGVHLSARRTTQRWPATRFAELIATLHEKLGAATMLFWSPGPENNPEHPGDDRKAKAVIDMVAGRALLLPWVTTDLIDLVGGLAECDAVICSDGGAMHVAAGLGKPIACLFGDSPVARWRPWGVKHIVLQAPSRKVEDISYEEAVGAVSRLLRD